MRRLVWVILAALLAAASPAAAHEVRPAYLELTQTDAETFDLLWKAPARGDMRLGLYVRLPESCEIVAEPRGIFVENTYIERSTVRHPGALVGETTKLGVVRVVGRHLVAVERANQPSLPAVEPRADPPGSSPAVFVFAVAVISRHDGHYTDEPMVMSVRALRT